MSEEASPPFFYANVMEITTGPFDLTIDFGYKEPEQAKRRSPDYTRVARVAMSPSHAKSMARILLEQIARYEEAFGVIPSPHFEDNKEGSE